MSTEPQTNKKQSESGKKTSQELYSENGPSSEMPTSNSKKTSSTFYFSLCVLRSFQRHDKQTAKHLQAPVPVSRTGAATESKTTQQKRTRSHKRMQHRKVSTISGSRQPITKCVRKWCWVWLRKVRPSDGRSWNPPLQNDMIQPAPRTHFSLTTFFKRWWWLANVPADKTSSLSPASAMLTEISTGAAAPACEHLPLKEGQLPRQRSSRVLNRDWCACVHALANQKDRGINGHIAFSDLGPISG